MNLWIQVPDKDKEPEEFMEYWFRTCEADMDVIEALIKALHANRICTLAEFLINFPGGSALSAEWGKGNRGLRLASCAACMGMASV